MTPLPDKDQIIAGIRAASIGYSLDPEILIRQCAAESSFNPKAHNFRTGAAGLFQLMPATAKEQGCSDPFNWKQSIAAGTKYMAHLLSRFGESYPQALAAYNWGQGNLHHLLQEHPSDWREHLPAETQGYLRKILVEAPPVQAA